MVAKGWVVLGCMIPVMALAQQQANLDFEVDTTPKDDSPDGWQITVTNDAKFEYWRGQAASGRFCARTIHERRDQSSVLAYRAADLIEPGRWYRIRYWFLAVGDSSQFGFQLMSSDLKQAHAIDGVLELPLTDGHWHRYQTYPFRVTADQLTEYPWLAFCHFPNHIGSIAVDDIAVEASAPPD
jgi:hypothetical protein